jgi:hypothetical protein
MARAFCGGAKCGLEKEKEKEKKKEKEKAKMELLRKKWARKRVDLRTGGLYRRL